MCHPRIPEALAGYTEAAAFRLAGLRGLWGGEAKESAGKPRLRLGTAAPA